MAAPYSDEHAEIAREILTKPLKELLAHGFDVVEAAHAFCREGLDLLAMEVTCPNCLSEELGAVIDAAEDYLDELPGAAEGQQSGAVH